MQDIIDKILSGVEKTTKVVVQKSTDVVESTKLRYSIMSEEGRANDIIKDIGQLVYDAYKSGEGSPESIQQKCCDLELLFGEIEDKKNLLAKLRNQKRCVSCGHSNEINASFCNRCGVKLADVEDTTAEDMFAEDVPAAASNDDAE